MLFVMEAEESVPCWSSHHLLRFVAPAAAALLVLALVVPRLLSVNYQLACIELKPGNPFDWSLDRKETDELRCFATMRHTHHDVGFLNGTEISMQGFSWMDEVGWCAGT